MENIILKPFKSSIHLELYDKDGNLLRTVDDHNAETLWAKAHTPTTIYFDLITIPLDQVLGLPITEINKTCFNKADAFRSRLLGPQFSRSGTTYDVAFNWTNTWADPVTVYGLMSFNGSNIYTLFDMSSDPITVVPGSVLIGRYQITYDNSTPSLSSETYSSSTISNNQLVAGMLEPTSPSVREYKYTRAFVKTSEYAGVDTTDTNITSSISVDITSSDVYKRMFGNTNTGELYYKFLASGNPGGARAVRYMKYYTSSHRSRLIAGNHTYQILEYIYDNIDVNFQYVEARTLAVDRNTTRLYPWKIHFPMNITDFPSSTWYYNGMGCYCNFYQMLVPRYVRTAAGEAFLQLIAYLYWNDTPTFNVYLYSRTSTIDSYLFVNGIKYTPVATTHLGNNNYKIEFDVSGLTAGEGIVVFNASNAQAFVAGYEYPGGTHVTSTKMAVESDMWGYVIPFAGFLKPGSSEINTSWISAGVANFLGSDIDLVERITEANVNQLNLVQNTPIDKIAELSEHQYFVWVKASETNKLAGEIGLNTRAKILGFWGATNYGIGYRNYDYTNTHVAPVFLTDSNIVSFRPTNVHRSNNYGDWLGCEGLLEDLYSLDDNNHIIIDHTNREITYVDDKPFYVLRNDSAYRKSYVVRKQGQTDYKYRIPEAVADYTEGNATVLHNGTTFEFETTIDTNETFKWVTVNFTPSSIFSLNEYMTFAVSDANGVLFVDKLESWKTYEVRSIVDTETTPIKQENSGTDDWITDTSSTDSRTLLDDTGEIQPVEILTPDTSIEIGNATHYIPFTITYNKDESSIKTVLSLPRVFDDGGTLKYINIESLVITDGLRVIPWSLDDAGMFRKETDIALEERFHNWIVWLSDAVLEQISEHTPTELLLYAYFEAKPKSELLPYEIEVKTHLKGPQGANDDRSVVLFRVEPPVGLQEVAKRNPALFSDYSFDYHNLTEQDDWFVFDKTQSSYIQLQDATNNPIYAASSNSDFTIDFWIRLNSLPDPGTVYYILDNTYDDNNGFRIWIDENGVLVVRAQNTNILYSNKLTVGQEYYIAIVGLVNQYNLYVDGHLQGIYPGKISIFLNTNRPQFVIGADRTISTGFFDGALKEFHVSWCARWYNDHIPPTDNWDNVDKWEQAASRDGDYIIKVILPFSVDRYIDVIDNDGNSTPFTLLRDLNFPIEDDSYIGNFLYIKLPSIKFSDKAYHTVHLQHVSNWYTSNIPAIGTSIDYDSVNKDYLINTAYSSATTALMPLPSDDFYNRQKWERIHSVTLPVTVSETLKFRIVDSGGVVKLEDPRTFFPLYLTPDRFYNESDKQFAWTYQDVTTTYYYSKPYLDSEGLQYKLSTENTVEIYSFYNTTESRGTVCKINAYEGTGDATSIGPTITLNNTHVKVSTLAANVPIVATGAHTNEPMRQQSVFKGHTIALVDSINLHTLVAYKELPYSWWTHQNLNISAYETFDIPTDYNMYRLEGIQYPIYKLTTPTRRLYLLDNERATLEYGAWKIDNQKAIDANTLSVRTYVVNDFVAHTPIYKNYVGVHVLSDPTKPLTYDIIHTKVSSHWKDTVFPAYMLITDSELVNLITSGNLHLPYTELAFINDTNAGVVSSGTTVSNTPTDTLVIYKYAVSAVTDLLSGSAYNGLAQLQYTKRVSAKDLFFKYRNKIHDYTLFGWVSKDKSFACYNGANCSTSNPYFLHLPQWLNSGLSAKLNYLDQEKRTLYLNAKQYVDHDKQGKTHTLYTTGAIDASAARVDVRIFPVVNTRFNILFDTTGLPVQSIEDLGNFVIVGDHDQPTTPGVNIYPLVKITNTDTGEEIVYALDNQYFTPKDVTTQVADFDNPDTRNWFDEYYAKNIFSFRQFNSLLSQYNSPEFTMQYGWIIYIQEPDWDKHLTLKAISIQPTFNDVSLYNDVPFAYLNEKAGIITDQKLDILPDSANYKVKIYNPNAVNYTDVVTRVDLSEIDLTSFTNGIVLYDSATNTPVPTIYETGDSQHVTNDFAQFNGRYVWIRIPSIDGNTTLEFTLFNVANTYTANDVFDFYSDFETIDTSVWNITYTEPTFSGSGGDTDNGTGATSTSDRIVQVKHNLPVQSEGKSLVFSNKVPINLSTTNDIDSTRLWEVCYQSESEISAELIYNSTTPTIQEDIIPYWHEFLSQRTTGSATGGDIDNGTGATSESNRGCFACIPYSTPITWVRMDVRKGENEIYVYFDSPTASDIGNPESTFDLFDDFNDDSKIVGEGYSISGSSVFINYPSEWIMSKQSVGKYRDYLATTRFLMHDGKSATRQEYRYVVYHKNSLTSGYISSYRESTTGTLRIGNSTVHSDYRYKLSDARVATNRNCAQHNVYSPSWRITQNLACPNTSMMMTIPHGNLIFRTWSYERNEWANWYLHHWYTTHQLRGHVVSYDKIEQGSWTVDGVTFSKRLRIRINSQHTRSQVVIPLEILQRTNETKIRITQHTIEFASTPVSTQLTMTDEILSRIQGVSTSITPEERIERISTNVGEFNGFTQFMSKLSTGRNEFYVYYGSVAAPERINEISLTISRTGDNLQDARYWYSRNWNDSPIDRFEPIWYSRHFLVKTISWNSMLNRIDTSRSYTYIGGYEPHYINRIYTSGSYLSYAGISDNTYEGGFFVDRTSIPHNFNGFTSNPSSYSKYQYNHTIETAIFRTWKTWVLPYRSFFITHDSMHVEVRTGVNIPRYRQRVYSVKYTPQLTAMYDLDWGVEETGSWMINGYEFTKRRKFIIDSSTSSNSTVIEIPREIHNNEQRIEIFRILGNGGQTIPNFDHVSTPVNVAFLFQDQNVYLKAEPHTKERWFINKYEEVNIKAGVPSTGKLQLNICTGEHERAFTLHWVRSYKKLDKPLVQLMKKDARLLIQNMNSNWYLIDYTGNTLPNTTSINAVLQDVKQHNLSADYSYDWKEIPDVAESATCGPYVHKFFLKYRLSY